MIRKSPSLYAGLGLIGLLGAGQAFAGCMSPSGLTPAANRASPAVYNPAGGFIRTAYESGDEHSQAGIVGLWKFEMQANGGPFDFGTIQWHDDGTEFTISGGRNPVDGDVCMGAWQQVGWNKFKLNHIALAYAGGAYLGVAHFHMTVTLAPGGNSYSGSFTVQQFADSTANPFDESGSPLATITGTVTATRVTASN